MDAVTEAHYRVQAVVIGDMGSIKAELGILACRLKGLEPGTIAFHFSRILFELASGCRVWPCVNVLALIAELAWNTQVISITHASARPSIATDRLLLSCEYLIKRSGSARLPAILG